MTTLYELSSRLRAMKTCGPEAAKRAGPRLHAQVAVNVAREEDTNGRPWKPRSEKVKNASGPMYTGAARAVQIVVRGSAILMTLPWEPYGRASRGAINRRGRGDRKVKVRRSRVKSKDPNKGLLPREILPGNPDFLPPAFAQIIRQEVDLAVSEALGQKVEGAAE